MCSKSVSTSMGFAHNNVHAARGFRLQQDPRRHSPALDSSLHRGDTLKEPSNLEDWISGGAGSAARSRRGFAHSNVRAARRISFRPYIVCGWVSHTTRCPPALDTSPHCWARVGECPRMGFAHNKLTEAFQTARGAAIHPYIADAEAETRAPSG